MGKSAMSDNIWNNPLMPAIQDQNKPKGPSIDLDAFDALISNAEDDSESDIISLDFAPPAKSFSSIAFGTPREEDTRLASHLEGVPPSGVFGGGVFGNKTATSTFDFYNASAMIGEEGGLAERLGVSDGTAIELGMASGMDIKQAIDNRDALRTSATFMSLFPQENQLDYQKLEYLREYAGSHNLDGLRSAAESFGANIDEHVTTTDLYYLTLATKADQKNFDILFNNTSKVFYQ